MQHTNARLCRTNGLYRIVMHQYWILPIIRLANIVSHKLADTDNQLDAYMYISLNSIWIWQNIYFKSTSCHFMETIPSGSAVDLLLILKIVAHKADFQLSTDNWCISNSIHRKGIYSWGENWQHVHFWISTDNTYTLKLIHMNIAKPVCLYQVEQCVVV